MAVLLSSLIRKLCSLDTQQGPWSGAHRGPSPRTSPEWRGRDTTGPLSPGVGWGEGASLTPRSFACDPLDDPLAWRSPFGELGDRGLVEHGTLGVADVRPDGGERLGGRLE